MMKPSLEELMQGIDSKYTLVVAAAKRARQLMMGYARLVECDSDKPVTVALEEIRTGKIRWEGSKTGSRA